MKNKIALESLALDLKRVALGLQRGSQKMSERFYEETLARKKEINVNEVKPYIRKLLEQLPSTLPTESRFAEDALMYSVLVENYAQKNIQ